LRIDRDACAVVLQPFAVNRIERKYEKLMMDMMKGRQRPLSFRSGTSDMVGMLHLPPSDPSAVIIGCHGLMANKESPKQIALAHRCVSESMAYFRFDHRGCGESGGDFATDTSLHNRRTDLLAAIDAVRFEFGQSIPIGLFGSSFGGTVCLTTANRIAPYALVTLAAPVQNRSIQIPNEAPISLKAEMEKLNLIFDIEKHLSHISNVLVVHGEKDEIVPSENATTIYRLARNPKRLLILKSSDHRVSSQKDLEKLIKEAVKWFLAQRPQTN
jgi:alpha-beta hydrolase superfamily lysophospholipase